MPYARRVMIVTLSLLILFFAVGVILYLVVGIEPAPVSAQGPGDVGATQAAESGDDALAPPAMERTAPGIGRVLGDNYWYIPFAVKTEAQMLAFLDAYGEKVQEGERPGDELTVAEGDGVCDSDTLYRLEEGVTDRFICDINNPAAYATTQSELPVMIAEPGPGQMGANVLFMDGHVEYVKLGEFPITEPVLKRLRDVDALEAG